MKKIGIVTTTVLSAAVLAMATLSFAQQDDKHGRPDRQDKHAQAQRGQQDRHAQNSKERGRPSRDDHARAERDRQRGEFHGQRASNFDHQHQGWGQRGGYNGYRIPDSRFRSSFGRNHSFRMSTMPYRGAGGHLRFAYGGYQMEMMEPYPEYWGPDWDRSDSMYVDFNDGGYYLYNRRFPGRPGVALSISF